jgi:antitoxin component YwqK of YwqJK toxin-antitoxin module
MRVYLNRLLYIIVLILYHNLIFSQENYNQTDSNGLKQGKWVKMWNNGMVKYQGKFKDGKPVGEFKYFYPSGKLQTVLTFSDDGRHAKNVTYSENGKKIASGEFIDKKKEGKWSYYSDIDGKLVSEENYSNGLLEGKAITYYPNTGKPFEIIEYKNGIKDGIWIKYFPEGEIMTKTFYKNGKLQGSFLNYSPEGKLLVKGEYNKGNQDGIWEFYDESGNLYRKEVYNEGRLINTISLENNKDK